MRNADNVSTVSAPARYSTNLLGMVSSRGSRPARSLRSDRGDVAAHHGHRAHSTDGRAIWTLRLEGALKDEWVGELRRYWRRIRELAAGAPIRVELADVGFVDPAGKVLLAEMYREGVEIVARGGLAAAIRDDIIDRSNRDRRAQ